MDQKYPQLVDRFQSTFIKTILIVISIFAFSSMSAEFKSIPDWVRIVLFTGLFFVYEPVRMTFGCTLGNYHKNIRIRKFSYKSKRINFFQVIIRFLFEIFLGWISFLTIHNNPKRRAFHDLVSGSVVIKI